MNQSPAPQSLTQEVLYARRHAGLFDLSLTWTALRLSGEDHLEFLHALTSNEVRHLPVGCGNHQALLNKKSQILADFRFYRLPNCGLLLVETDQCQNLKSLLEQFIFSEDVVIEDLTTKIAVLGLQGPDSALCLNERLDEASQVDPLARDTIYEGTAGTTPVTLLACSLTVDPGYLILWPRSRLKSGLAIFQDPAQGLPARPLSLDALEVLRVEAGLPRYGRDMGADVMLMELGREDEMISFSKGCYPGQEVVARTHSRGNLQKKLQGLKTATPMAVAPGTAITSRDQAVGEVRSACWSPTLEATIMLAYLKRHLQPGSRHLELVIGDTPCQVQVVSPPFYFPPDLNRRAREHYQQGMDHFHQDRLARAQSSFEAALRVNPHLADAVEALGMTLERQGDTDAAIKLNERFARLEPEAVMAHANLSRLYLVKGWKDRAEEEQARAQALGLRLKSQEVLQQNRAAEEAAARKKEEARRLEIFRQVLEMDAEDEVANFGLGRWHLEQNSPREAITHLQRVVEANPRFSKAFALLGKALIAAGETQSARERLHQGIQVATAQGDMMPQKEMEALLEQLGSAS